MDEEKQPLLDHFNAYLHNASHSSFRQWGDYIEIKPLFVKKGRSIHLVFKKTSDRLYLLKEFEADTLSTCREAKMMNDLCYAGIPKVVDQFVAQDHIILVRDYIQGSSLETVLQEKGYLSEQEALDILLQLCGIIKYLHERQPYPIIHRDIKPANLILSEQKQIWLIDFDSAREYKPGASSDTQYFGTQGYAAPEQYGFAQTDQRTDIFSLGTLLYILLTGRHSEEPGDPTEKQPKHAYISTGLLRIINKCTRFDPDRRYKSVNELIQALKLYQKRVGIRIVAAASFLLLCFLGFLVSQQILSQPVLGAVQPLATEARTAPFETSPEAVSTGSTIAFIELLPETNPTEPTIAVASSEAAGSTDATTERLTVETANAPTSATEAKGSIPYPKGLPYGTLLRSSSPLHLSNLSQIGITGDGGPDWDFDGTVEVYTFIHWQEKMELHIGWRERMDAFNLYEAIPKIGLNEDGSPKIAYKMELSCVDLDKDGVLEMLVSMGDTESEMGLTIVRMDAIKQTFHICEDQLIGGRFMYLDDALRIVVPSNDHNMGGIYKYQDGRLVLQ